MRPGEIGRKYKNIKRYKEILKILRKYGFGYLVDKMGVQNPLSKLYYKKSKLLNKRYTRAERIRMAIEELGPAFIKLGQILSTRYDILPADIVDELTKLQDNVKAFDLSMAQKIFTEELGVQFEDIFETFNKEPIAAASIGQVYSAKLKSGEEVVVKIQRPNIEKIIDGDIDILYSIAKLLDYHFNRNKIIKAVDIVNEFSHMIKRELDYTYEARNCETFRENFKKDDRVYIPKIYWEYTTKKILVMEKINGIKVSNIKELEKMGFHKEKLAKLGATIFIEQIFIHGFFHGDPHPGNIMVIDENKLSFIDFGIVGYIDKKLLRLIVDILRAGIKQEVDIIYRSLAKIDAVTTETNQFELKRDLYYFLNYYFNVPVNKINFSEALLEILSMSYKHKLNLPNQLILVIKAIITIEGTGKRLNPNFNLSTITSFAFSTISKKRKLFKDVFEDTLYVSKESLNELLEAPKLINNILQNLEKNQFKFVMKQEGLNELQRELKIMTNKISLSLILSSIVIGSSIMLQVNQQSRTFNTSFIGIFGFVISSILGFFLIVSILLGWIKNKS